MDFRSKRRKRPTTTDGAPHLGAIRKMTLEMIDEMWKLHAALKSQEQIAKKLGVSQGTISRYLRRGRNATD